MAGCLIVQGFVSEAEYSKKLKTFDEVYEGNRLDYNHSMFNLTDEKYGKIRFKYCSGNKIQVPRYPATVENYPYTARGFTASRKVILPEWELMENCVFEEGDIFEVYDRSGKIIEKYEFKGKGWMIQ